MIPADLSPSQLFETYLPAEWARARAAAPPSSIDASVEITLDGDDGGTWTIALAGGAMTVTAAAATTPPALRVHMTTTDFRAAVQGEPGAPDLFPKDLDLAGLFARVPSGNAPQAPVTNGAIEVALTGFHGRTWKIAATTGDGGPTATVTTDVDTVIALRDGKLDPMSAFFGGKIQLGGDVAWIMQAGMSLMQKRGPAN